jgi:hypothetical protein
LEHAQRKGRGVVVLSVSLDLKDTSALEGIFQLTEPFPSENDKDI